MVMRQVYFGVGITEQHGQKWICLCFLRSAGGKATNGK